MRNSMRRIRHTALLLFLAYGLPLGLQGLVPNTLNYQGRIRLSAGGAPVPDSSGNTVVFGIFNVASGGAALWTETWNNTTSYVTTSAGLFNVVLGSWTAITVPF